MHTSLFMDRHISSLLLKDCCHVSRPITKNERVMFLYSMFSLKDCYSGSNMGLFQLLTWRCHDNDTKLKRSHTNSVWKLNTFSCYRTALQPFLEYSKVLDPDGDINSHQQRLFVLPSSTSHLCHCAFLIFSSFSSLLFFPPSSLTPFICSQSVSMNCEKHELGLGERMWQRAFAQRWGNITHESTCMDTHRDAVGTCYSILYSLLWYHLISLHCVSISLSFSNVVHTSFCMSRGIRVQLLHHDHVVQYGGPNMFTYVLVAPCHIHSHLKIKSNFHTIFLHN